MFDRSLCSPCSQIFITLSRAYTLLYPSCFPRVRFAAFFFPDNNVVAIYINPTRLFNPPVLLSSRLITFLLFNHLTSRIPKTCVDLSNL